MTWYCEKPISVRNLVSSYCPSALFFLSDNSSLFRVFLGMHGGFNYLFSLHIRSMWETTVMHKQVSGWTVNFGPNFPESPFLELKTRKPPPPPISENFRFGMTKVYSGIPPHFGKLQIWDDQSLLRNTPPPISENFRFGMTKVYFGIPPPPWKLSESPSPRVSEYRELLHVETLSNPDNY